MIGSLWIALAAPAWAQNVGIDSQGGGCQYATLEDAVANAAAGDEIRLRDGWLTVEGDFTIAVDVAILTGNNNCAHNPWADPAQIDGGGTLGPIEIAFGTTVSIENVELAHHTSNFNGGSLYVGGDLTLIDTTVFEDSGDYGGAIYVDTGGTLTASGGTTILNNDALNGGGVYIDVGGTATFEDTSVVWINEAVDNGGGIYVAGELILEDDAVVLANTAGAHGGGVFLTGTGAISGMGGTISGNVAGTYGGGIGGLGASTEVSLAFTTLNANRAVHGGAIRTNGPISLDSVVLDGNSATGLSGAPGTGGAIASSTSVEIYDSTLSNNTATGDGGAIQLPTGGALVIHNGEIIGNDAGGNGGGVRMFGGGTADLRGTRFEGNHADGDGGAIHVDEDAVLTSVYSWYHANHAVGNGGAISAVGGPDGRPTVDIDGPWGHECTARWNPGADEYCSEIRDNTAATGAGIHAVDADFDIDRTAFVANLASVDGHAIWLVPGSAAMTANNTLVAGHRGTATQHVVYVGAGTRFDVQHLTFGGNAGVPVRYTATSTGQFSRSIVWNGAAFAVDAPRSLTAHCTSFGAVTGTVIGLNVDLNQNPQFVTDATRGRYHLAPGTSPGVDRCVAGDPVDLDSVARFQRVQYDRGAFEAL